MLSISALVLLALLFGLSYLSPNYAPSYGLRSSAAMGNPPGSCPNEYSANFDSFTVDTGMQKIDVIANAGVTFTALASEGYNVSFVLHTSANSSQGNTANGSVWLSSNTPGYQMGACVGQEINGTWLWGFNENGGNGSVQSNENLSMGWNVQTAYSYNPSTNGVEYGFSTDGPNMQSVYYNVIWIEQTSTDLTCYTEQNATVTCNSTVTGIQPSSSPFRAPSGTVNFATNSSIIGYCALANLNSDNSNNDSSTCSFSLTPSGTGVVNITAYYQGDSLHAGSNNSTEINILQTTSSTTTNTSSVSQQTTATSTSFSRAKSTSSSDPTSSTESSHTLYSSTTSLRPTNSEDTNSIQHNTRTTFPTIIGSSSVGSGGLDYTESIAALVISAIVIGGILSVSIRKSW